MQAAGAAPRQRPSAPAGCPALRAGRWATPGTRSSTCPSPATRTGRSRARPPPAPPHGTQGAPSAEARASQSQVHVTPSAEARASQSQVHVTPSAEARASQSQVHVTPSAEARASQSQVHLTPSAEARASHFKCTGHDLRHSIPCLPAGVLDASCRPRAAAATGRRPDPQRPRPLGEPAALTFTMTVAGTRAKCSWSSRYAATSRSAASPTRTVGFKPGSPSARPTNPCTAGTKS